MTAPAKRHHRRATGRKAAPATSKLMGANSALKLPSRVSGATSASRMPAPVTRGPSGRATGKTPIRLPAVSDSRRPAPINPSGNTRGFAKLKPATTKTGKPESGSGTLFQARPVKGLEAKPIGQMQRQARPVAPLGKPTGLVGRVSRTMRSVSR